ncbi:hypothetical protein AVEN_221245-1 [Araneus ventricosus]|uniref:Uncharacterized protein n=1 Tax=Araneus ventricosus TaxID=182803 RepID=A0A4Y2F794_ARAVE|nr:hypothetical protein AVEN_221245-1 [Araneus ventricosus]
MCHERRSALAVLKIENTVDIDFTKQHGGVETLGRMLNVDLPVSSSSQSVSSQSSFYSKMISGRGWSQKNSGSLPDSAASFAKVSASSFLSEPT